MSAFSLLLHACASVERADKPAHEPAVVEDRVVIDGAVLPLPQEPDIQVESMPGIEPASPVVTKLMVSADAQQRDGNLDGAANSLERALRIEPRNAHLWNRLAEVRYAQQDWLQSVQLAAKSNTLVGSSTTLRRRNWYLMANAYDSLGDTENARKYRDKLSQ